MTNIILMIVLNVINLHLQLECNISYNQNENNISIYNFIIIC